MPTFSWRGNWISAAASWAHQWNLRNCCLEAARTRAKAHRSVWKVHLNIDNVCVFSIYKPLQTHTTPNALRPHESFTMWNSTSIWIFPQNKRNQQGSTTPGHLKLCCKDDPVASLHPAESAPKAARAHTNYFYHVMYTIWHTCIMYFNGYNILYIMWYMNICITLYNIV